MCKYEYIKLDNTEVVLFNALNHKDLSFKLMKETTLLKKLYELFFEYNKDINNDSPALIKAAILDNFINDVSTNITEVFGIDIMNNCFKEG